MRDQFADVQLPTPALDARLLAERAFGLSGVALAAEEHQPALPAPTDCLNAFAQRRLAGEPVARILGSKEFYGLEFGLNAATLVPRPETELLVELGLTFLKTRHNARILDLGTGSGCIMTALLHHAPDVSGVAVDLSDEALAQATTNAQNHDVSARVEFRNGSWLSPLKEKEKFDLIVSNPPYIESNSIAALDKDVRVHDPLLALDGGPDGLLPYRIIAAEARDHLVPGGAIVVEVGAGQTLAVENMFQAAGFSKTSVHNDLAGILRAVFAIS